MLLIIVVAERETKTGRQDKTEDSTVARINITGKVTAFLIRDKLMSSCNAGRFLRDRGSTKVFMILTLWYSVQMCEGILVM